MTGLKRDFKEVTWASAANPEDEVHVWGRTWGHQSIRKNKFA